MLPKVDYVCITPLFCILFEKIEWLKTVQIYFCTVFFVGIEKSNFQTCLGISVRFVMLLGRKFLAADIFWMGDVVWKLHFHNSCVARVWQFVSAHTGHKFVMNVCRNEDDYVEN